MLWWCISFSASFWYSVWNKKPKWTWVSENAQSLTQTRFSKHYWYYESFIVYYFCPIHLARHLADFSKSFVVRIGLAWVIRWFAKYFFFELRMVINVWSKFLWRKSESDLLRVWKTSFATNRFNKQFLRTSGFLHWKAEIVETKTDCRCFTKPKFQSLFSLCDGMDCTVYSKKDNNQSARRQPYNLSQDKTSNRPYTSTETHNLCSELEF